MMNKILNVLIGCEKSQIICTEFRKLGYDAFSCDLQKTTGSYPEYHLQMDIFKAIDLKRWDLIIAHPPCKFLSYSGVRHLYVDGLKINGINQNRWKEMEKAVEFFNKLLAIKCDHICLENPIQHSYAFKRISKKYRQIIQPYQFGHPEQKSTCLWLKNLPILNPTNLVLAKMMKLPIKERQRVWWIGGKNGNDEIRAITFLGIAEAMAFQWSKAVLENYHDIKPMF